MNIDYANLEKDLEEGTFRQRLEEELLVGFRQLRLAGEPLPLASYYASQIAEIVNRDADLTSEMKYYLYQEILLAVEQARAAVLGEPVKPVH